MYVKATVGEVEIGFDYDFGDTLETLVEQFTEEVVYKAAMKSFVISLQAVMRQKYQKDRSTWEDECEKWKPGIRRSVDKVEKVTKLTERMSPEEKAALLELLQS